MIDGIEIDKLNLNGALITKLEIVPARKICITLMIERKLPQNYMQEYDLHFTGLRDFHLNFSSDLWVNIKKVRHLRKSNVLREYQRKSNTRNGNIADVPVKHFRVYMDNGNVDILATSLAILDVERIFPAMKNRGQISLSEISYENRGPGKRR